MLLRVMYMLVVKKDNDILNMFINWFKKDFNLDPIDDIIK